MNKPVTSDHSRGSIDIKPELIFWQTFLRKSIKDNWDNSSVPDLATINSVAWMDHCVNLPFLSQSKNKEINYSIISQLKNFENVIKV